MAIAAQILACTPPESAPSGHGRAGMGEGPTELHRIAWKVVTETEIGTLPAVGEAGIAVVTSGGIVRVVEPEAGDEIWREKRDASIWSDVAWAGQKLVVGDDRGRVARLNVDDRAVAWESELSGPVEGGLIVEQGVVYAGTSDGAVTALALDDGRPLWEVRLQSAVTSRVALHGDQVIFGGSDGKIHLVSAISGEPVGAAKCGTSSVTQVAAVEGLRVATCGRDIVAVGPNGKGVWKANAKSIISGGIAIANGRVFIGTEDGLVLAFDQSSGDEVWRHQTKAAVIGPMAASGSAVYAADHNGVVHAISSESGDELFVFRAESRTLGGVVASDGRLYFGDVDGNLYAIE